LNINNIQELIDANTVGIDEPPAIANPRRPAPNFPESFKIFLMIITGDEEDS